MPFEKQTSKMVVRTEDWSKCRNEQGHLYRFPAQIVSPQKMLTSVNFEIMPCVEYQSVVTFLYCQMLVSNWMDTMTCGPQGCFPEMNMPLCVSNIMFLLGCVLMSWTGLLPLFGWVLANTTPNFMTTAKKMVCEMHCFLCGEQCLFKSLWETFWNIQPSSSGPRKSD